MTTTRRMLAPLRPAARILTGSTYALLGFDALRAPGARVDQAAPMLSAVREIVPLPADDALGLRGNAAAQVLGGTLLALGRAPRLSALVLAGSLIPTTLAGHAYWRIEDLGQRLRALVAGDDRAGQFLWKLFRDHALILGDPSGDAFAHLQFD